MVTVLSVQLSSPFRRPGESGVELKIDSGRLLALLSFLVHAKIPFPSSVAGPTRGLGAGPFFPDVEIL